MAPWLLAESLAEQGQFHEGPALEREGIRIAEALDHAFSLVLACWGPGYVHMLIASHAHPPDAETAEDRYRQATSLSEELGMRPLVAHCHLGLGKLYRRTGDRAKADEQLQTATTMYREMDMGGWLAQAEAALREAG
jgi:hypothetical protein